ncbi:DUF3822 family protein [Pseudochryseolinea flava]|uniref:DUF3822 domain-containing protein n=1 Tax=Pseudochryseolinea flava TaxID=2059302 RepID=A0A364XY96_9BACT|nr:DUF3822 family protein [Pseudochryseolinea flava]RAV98772.1 hypothetical protein DQQ10_22405 [Pseudochryseolinea flava]
MQTTSLNYKLIKKIKDERFDEEFLHHYHLLIQLGTRDFQLLVVDPSDNKILLLEDFVLPNLTSHEELMNMLDQLFDSHALLKAGFWKQIKVSIKNLKFVQVPQALFAEEAMEEYLRFNAQVDPDKEVFLSTVNKRAHAVTIFAINKDLKLWLDSVYPNNPPIYTHQAAALIEGMMQFAGNRKDEPLYIYVDRFKLHLLACRDGKLLYYNQFAIKQFSDYVKYIMLVMKSLNMDQQSSKVVLWGYIGKNSPHYHEFYKYVSNVVFGNRPDHLQFNYIFDEIQEHHFFDLYSIHLIQA